VKWGIGISMEIVLKRRSHISQKNYGNLNGPSSLKNGKAGFTLIELLIVIVIISIVSSVALLTISQNQNKNIEYFAHEFVQIMTLAEHEALLRPATLGLGLTAGSYQFYSYHSSGKWQPLTDNNLNLHTIPDKIQITLKMNDKIVELNAKPVIIISESGDLTPFVMLLGRPEKRPTYQIIGDANGNVKSSPLHEE
jgi:general secretion pathway protein H